MNKVFYILALINMCSCTKIVRIFYGIRDTKLETRESINKYIAKKRLNPTNNYFISAEGYVPTFLQINKHFPEALVFDKSGRELRFKPEGKSCNGFIEPFLTKLTKEQQVSPVDTFSLKTLTGYLDKEQNLDGIIAGGQDYTVVIFWFIPVGKLNTIYVKKWEELAMNNNNANIKVIKVNMDFSKTWTETEYNNVQQGFADLKKRNELIP